MTLAAALQHQREQGIRKGPDCRVCVIVRMLSGPDQQALADAMADPRLTTSAITRALKSEGHEVSQTSVGRHRKGECNRR